jgi:serine/threonine protein phosphatase 1
MKYFVISDPHGHYTEMIAALNEAGFDENNPDHHLVIAGDLFDRGAENIKILEYVHALLIKGKVTLIKGNHEEFFFLPQDFVWNYQNNGFDTTVDEFLGDIEPRSLKPYDLLNKILSLQPKLGEVLSSMFDSFKVNNYIITHAGLDTNGRPNNWNSTEDWIRSGINDDDGNIYIFGHRNAFYLNRLILSQKKNEIFNYKNYIGIDGAVTLFKKMFVYIIEDNEGEINHYE